MLTLPTEQTLDAITTAAATVEGHMSAREVRFLALLGACKTAEGAILEIGSFRGRSTVVLGKAVGDGEVVHACDPLTIPAQTGDYKGDKDSIAKDFHNNIDKHGVKAKVVVHQMFSTELAPTWSEPLRLLWIDGDHSYQGTKPDFDLFAKFVVPNGIIAFHDVLHPYDGPVRVFMEDVLASDRWGACGVVGSIGWAQRVATPEQAALYREKKIALHKKLAHLVPYAKNTKHMRGLQRLAYKFWRSRVPHQALAPLTFREQLAA